MMKWGRISLTAAIFFILSAFVHKILLWSGSTNETVIYLENIGFEAFFFFGSLILSISMFPISNSKDPHKDSQAVPIVGGTGEAWQDEVLDKLHSGIDEKIVLPLYGSDANITKPRK